MSSSETIVNGTKEFAKHYNSLDKKSREFKEIDEALALLKENCSIGNIIKHELWPKHYIKKYRVVSLFRFELRSGWRLIYEVRASEKQKTVTVLEVMDHKAYEKRFGF